MFVRVFRKVYWYTPILLLLISGLLWLKLFIYPPDNLIVTGTGSGPLFDLLIPFFTDKPLLTAITSFVVLMVQVFYINQVATSKEFTDRYSALPGLIYLLLMSSTPAMISFYPLLFANLFLIPALNKLFDVYDEESISRELFNAGFLIAMAGLFYYPALTFYLALITSVFLYYIVSLRRIIASLLGLISPALMLFVYFLLVDEFLHWYEELTFVAKPLQLLELEISIYQKLFIGVLSVFSIVAFLRMQLIYKTAKPIRTRKRITLLYLFFFISVLSYLLAHDFSHVHHALLTIPLTITLAVFFYDMRSQRLTEILFGILLLFILAGRAMVYIISP
ncbi:MAG: hypothetical protein RG741_07070 [Bacteroidales bacterium]|nr:hypothetical protein [Bacteroidales bacterium]